MPPWGEELSVVHADDIQLPNPLHLILINVCILLQGRCSWYSGNSDHFNLSTEGTNKAGTISRGLEGKPFPPEGVERNPSQLSLR